MSEADIQALRIELAEVTTLLRGTLLNAPLSAEELASRWRITGTHWRRELLRKCNRLGLHPLDLAEEGAASPLPKRKCRRARA
jgi:hypothetical protein